jgi:hypothetical protein
MYFQNYVHVAMLYMTSHKARRRTTQNLKRDHDSTLDHEQYLLHIGTRLVHAQGVRMHFLLKYALSLFENNQAVSTIS